MSNTGIGDFNKLFDQYHIGALVERFEPAAYQHALEQVRSMTRGSAPFREACDRAIRERFSIEVGVRAYAGIYQHLLGEPEPEPTSVGEHVDEAAAAGRSRATVGSEQS